MESKFKRIFITGASGTGKTTLANTISKEFNLPFISTSAKEIWPKFGFKDHQSAHRHSCYDPRVGNQYQHEVFKQRISALEGKKKFVSDRSPFDNYAYYLMQIGYMNGSFENEIFRVMCQDHLYLADALIFLRYPDTLELKNDGARIINPDYQRMVDSTINLVVKKLLRHSLPILEINTWDLTEKSKMLGDFLSNE